MKIEKLDSVLNKLEMIACYCIEHEDGPDKQANEIISYIDNLTVQCINELDEIVPRPLPEEES